jgi:MoxR-like ATPase
MSIAIDAVAIQLPGKGITHMTRLTDQQRKIAEACGISPHTLAARLSRSTQSAEDPDDDTEARDDRGELDEAINHLAACDDEGEDVMSRVEMARDALNSFLSRKGGMAKTANSAHGVVFPPHRRSV